MTQKITKVVPLPKVELVPKKEYHAMRHTCVQVSFGTTKRGFWKPDASCAKCLQKYWRRQAALEERAHIGIDYDTFMNNGRKPALPTLAQRERW